jgi:hypothetical protein
MSRNEHHAPSGQDHLLVLGVNTKPGYQPAILQPSHDSVNQNQAVHMPPVVLASRKRR